MRNVEKERDDEVGQESDEYLAGEARFPRLIKLHPLIALLDLRQIFSDLLKLVHT